MSTNSALFAAMLGLVCAASCQAAEAEPQSPGVVQKVERAVEHGAEVAASGVKRGAKAAAHGVQVAASATAHGVQVAASGVAKGANAAAHGVESVAGKVKNSATTASSASQ